MLAKSSRLRNGVWTATLYALLSTAAVPALAAGASAAPVETDTLSSISIDATGALTDADGGLPADLWRGTTRSLVASLLPRLPVATPSPATRSLMRRLLLSAATPPAGDQPAGELINERAWMLWRAGDLEGLLRLIAAVPVNRWTPWLLRLEAEARLLGDDVPGACRIAAVRIGEDPDSFWQRLQGFCHARTGEVKDAELTVALLADRGEDMRAYAALIGVITGTGSLLPRVLDPSPLDIAMLRAANASPSPQASAEDLPLVIAIAESPGFRQSLRAAAAERAVAAGVLPATVLRLLYQQMSSSKPSQASVRTSSRDVSSEDDLDVLVRRAIMAETPIDRVEAMVLALDTARREGRYLATVRALSPELAAYGPAPELAGYAQHLVPAMLAMGEHGLAATWMSWLEKQAPLSPVADAALGGLMPLARLAKLPQAADWQASSLFDWWQAERSRPGGRLRAVRLFALLRATGEAVPNELWTEMLDGPAQEPGMAIDPAFRTRLVSGAHAGQIGWTVLLSLVSMGHNGPETINVAGLEAVIDSLRIVGLESDARAIAVEAMAAAQ